MLLGQRALSEKVLDLFRYGGRSGSSRKGADACKSTSKKTIGKTLDT